MIGLNVRAAGICFTSLCMAFQVHAVTVPLSTYIGGEFTDTANGVAVDSQGNTYVCGTTDSPDFPLVNAFDSTLDGGASDAFVMKINTNGQIVFSTLLGASGSDNAYGIAVDSASNIYVTGSTSSGFSFPFTNGFQSAPNVAGTYGFITKIGPSGTNLIYSSYLGGTNGSNGGRSIAVDAAGIAYVAGYSFSSNFPVKNPLQSTNLGGREAFVTKVAAAGTNLIYSTYLGGSGNDEALGITADSSGNAYVAGDTASANFFTTNALIPSYQAGGGDGFIVNISPSGSNRLFSTFFGGSSEDHLTGIALDAKTNIYFTGYGQSSDLPITNAIQPFFAGSIWDVIIASLSPSGTQLLFSTYFGGESTDAGFGISIDGEGNILVSGDTESSNFPVAGGTAQINGSYDVFALKLLAGGQKILYSTYLGGSAFEFGAVVAAHRDGTAHIAGRTLSTNFFLANATQSTYAGNQDAFLTRIASEPVMLQFSNSALSTVAGWNTYSGQTYKAQVNSNVIDGTWKDLNLPVKAGAGACCISVTQSPSSQIEFFRAVQTDPLLCTNTYASCGVYQDQTSPASNRVVTFANFAYSPACIRIKAGQSITFSGTFSFHPFLWQCQQGGTVTNTPPSGSLGVFTFPTPGYYNYKCAAHGDGFNMRGSIEVVP